MKKILAILCLLLVASGCAFQTNVQNSKYEKEQTFLGNLQDENGEMVLLLNTETYITTVNPTYKNDLITLAKDEISKYHMLLDSHHYYLNDKGTRITNIKALNESIDKGPIEVDPIIVDAINKAKELTILTQGYFNFTLGKLSNLYHDKLLPYDSENSDPSRNDIENTLKGIIEYDKLDDYIIVNKENNTIEIKSKDQNNFNIDLGAFSKGYILNKVYEKLIKYNTSFLLTAGSSSIVTYANKDENITWNVAIKNPSSIDNQLLAFTINNGAISSSGDYENYYFTSEGIRRHHILNPYTGYPENYYRSNTIISKDACIIDALSTALFNVKDSQLRSKIINDISAFYDTYIDYCFVNDDIDLIISKGFKDNMIDMYTSKDVNNIIIES